MAKRRKLEAPSSADLDKLEQEFRRETSAFVVPSGKGIAPIAQEAADSAEQAQPLDTSDRTRQAELEASESQLKKAQSDGRLMVDLPVGEIDAKVMVRDRANLNLDEMGELKQSISKNGLRLPIEVFELQNANDTLSVRYGLISGYRRLLAMRELLGLADKDEREKYETIRAVIRPRSEADAAFVSMVEENEVRSELSQFERGRIAVMASQQGAFLSVDEAVSKLFATGSRAKRSKVRSFALIFAELGDMLEFPHALTEKRGLRLATALKQGAEASIRNALAATAISSDEEEWNVIESVIDTLETPKRDPKRGGRPKSTAPVSGWQNADKLITSNGITIRKKSDSKGYVLRFEGRQIDKDVMDTLVDEIRNLLEKT